MTDPTGVRFGVYGRLDRAPIDGRLICHVCGAGYTNLAQHARLAHGLDAVGYRELAGLNQTTRLMSDDYRARIREASAPLIARLRAQGKLRNWGEDRQKFVADKAAAVAALNSGLAAEAREHRRASWTPERRADVAQQTADRNRSGDLRATPDAIKAGLARTPQACRSCGATFTRRSPRHYYCDACAVVRQREVSRLSAARKRQEQRRTPESR